VKFVLIKATTLITNYRDARRETSDRSVLVHLVDNPES